MTINHTPEFLWISLIFPLLSLFLSQDTTLHFLTLSLSLSLSHLYMQIDIFSH